MKIPSWPSSAKVSSAVVEPRLSLMPRLHLMPPAASDAPARSEAPARSLARLFRLVELSNVRYSDLIHYPWNLLTLWDIHVLVRLERWKEKHGAALRGWMIALGRTDTLSALAGLAHAHPRLGLS